MEGPWEFGGDLLIVADFDGSKKLKELEFNYAPVWIRVFDLPLGMMNEETGKAIGDKVGKALETDVDANGSAVGGYLRVKVQVDVRKPLLRGVTMQNDGEGDGDWCPIQYEFLPNFCYGCGLLGHVLRECDYSLGKEGEQQYGDWLRASPAKRRSGDTKGRWSGGGSSGGSRQQLSLERGGVGVGKELVRANTSSQKDSSRDTSELRDDGTSPMKEPSKFQKEGTARVLHFGVNEELKESGREPGRQGRDISHEVEDGDKRFLGEVKGGDGAQESVQAVKECCVGGSNVSFVEEKDGKVGEMEIDDDILMVKEAEDAKSRAVVQGKSKRSSGTFRRLQRSMEKGNAAEPKTQRKRIFEGDVLEVEEEQKRMKVEREGVEGFFGDENQLKAGLLERPRLKK